MPSGKTKIRIALFICFLLPVYLLGLTQTDSLLIKLKLAKHDTLKIEILNQLVWELKEIDPVKAVMYGKEAISIAKKLNRSRSVAQSMNNLGTVLYIGGNYPEALQYYLDALEIREQLKDSAAIGKSYNNIALVYYEEDELEKSLEYHNKSLKIKFKTNDLKGMASSYGNIGNVFYKFAKKATGHKRDSILNLCLNYQVKTLDIQSQMIQSASANVNLLAGKSATYNNLGNIYFEKAILNHKGGEFKLALSYHTKALEIQQKINDQRGISHSYINMASIYLKLKQPTMAVDFYNKALTLVVPVGLKEEQKTCYEGLSEVFEQHRDFEKSLFYYKKFNDIKDSILNIAKSEQITEMQTKYDADKIGREIELLQKDKALKESEISKQKTVRNSFIFGFALVIALIVILLNRFRLKTQSARELTLKNRIIEEKQKEIIDSIRYAKRIQESLLPSEKYIERILLKSLKNK